MRRRRTGVAVLLAGLLLAACGGGPDPLVSPADESSSALESAAPPSTADTSPLAEDTAPLSDETLPAMPDGFGETCSERVGFAGTTPYTTTRGVHPMVLLYWHEDMQQYLESLMYLPRSWRIKEDKFRRARDSELARVELVGCEKVVSSRPTGKVCTYDDVRLKLVADTVEVTVYEARTGKKLGSRRFVDPKPVCPWSTMYSPGDTELSDWPPDSAIIGFLRRFVSP